MSIEKGSERRKERFEPYPVPEEFAKHFVDGTLAERASSIEKTGEYRDWRCFEQKVEVPGVGSVLLRMEYRQFADHDGESPSRFDNIRFNFVDKETNANGAHSNIAGMSWYVERGQSTNPYSFDLMQVHRYVEEKYRDRKGVGKALYMQSEAWAQQVANVENKELLLALSTDQPSAMSWAVSLGYVPYPEEVERYEEVVAHPERFTLIKGETDSMGQARGTAIERDGKRWRVWFQKRLTPDVL